MKKGFTLLELLVVVMIIGILSSIALPQYKKAVEKARVTEGLVVLKALADAQERYLQANPGETGVTKRTQVADVDLKGGVWWVGAGNTSDRFATEHFVYTLVGDGQIKGERADHPQQNMTTRPKYTITYQADGTRGCTATTEYAYICTMFEHM